MTTDESDNFTDDLKSIVKEESVTEEQQEFNNLSNSSKFDRLNNLVKKSQIYSQIIADQILQNTSLKKQARNTDESKDYNNNEPRKKPKHTGKSTKKPKGQLNILDMLAQPKSSQTTQPKLITGKMKDYQLDGLEWLITLYENGLNGILADEMGLGKTLQCISFICFLIENGITGPYLIVGPLSTLTNWYNEFKTFAPSINVLKYTGEKNERHSLDLRSPQVILTSYELSIKDFSRFNSVNWKFLIIDEGHRLKNIECLLIKILKRLNVTNRLLITGTPLQNNLNELWSLLNFILPDIFHDLQLFQQWFNFDELVNLKSDRKDDEVNEFIEKNIQNNLIKNLHTILKPFILRRLKKDVIKDLPPKKEYLIHLPLTDYQKKLYDDALNGNLFNGIHELYCKDYNKFNIGYDSKDLDTFLQKAVDNDLEEIRVNSREKTLRELYLSSNKQLKNNLRLQNIVMQLRNICNSPYLYYEPFPIQNEHLTSKDSPPKNIEKQFINELLNNSSKFKILDQLLENLLPDHKVLIFSQFTKTLDLINDYLNFKGIKSCRFDGSTNQEDRDEQIKSFYKREYKIFLLSTRSGGLGINLIPADTVIIFDNDWNPQVDLQAIDRCHRIGQKKPIKIFRFLIKNSIEEILIVKNYSRRFLERIVIQMGEFRFNKLSSNNLNFNNEFNSLINLSKKLGITGSSEEFNFDYDHTKSIDLLPETEIKELMDRDQCFLNTSNDFENISVFETINKLDDE